MNIVRTRLALSAVFVALVCSAHGQATHQQSLAGEWRYLPYSGDGDLASAAIDDSKWPTMALPSNWFLQGSTKYPANAKATVVTLAANAPGVLAPIDPEAGLDYAGTVWFRRNFEWEGDRSHPAILDVDMSDYYTDVFVNGHAAGHHEGYFQLWSVDLTKYLRSGRNLIALRISAPPQPFDMSQQFPVSWPKNQNQIKGIFAYHDTRPGGTSVRGQERSTGGLIRDISLRSSSGVDLIELNVTPLDVTQSSARLLIKAKLHNWTAESAPISVAGQIHAANFSPDVPLKFSVSGNASPGDSYLTTELRVDHPALWWSWDYGKPNLYKASAQLMNSAGAPIDAKQVQFGIRSISHDDQWVWHLNGERIYQRGSNYIATQWMSQADRAWYERDVKLMKEANLNAVRVHAHLERPEFYDVADELGVMVWQDFPLQWGYTDMPSFHQNASQQARDMVERYFDHPSIIAWCIHNESPHAMDWMQKRDPKQNLQLDTDLVAEVASLDPSRVAHRDSGTGDGHTYPGWYNGNIREFKTEQVPPFITEYGAEALPNLETLRTIFDTKDLFPSTDDGWEAWKYADFQPQQTFKDNGIDKGASIEEFIRNSQAYQVKIIRYGTENFRRQKWTKSTGIYQFMFTDDWPSITWSVLDYYRRPKAGFFALQNSMQPVLPSIDYQIDNPDAPLSIVVVNDLHQSMPAILKWWVGEAGSHQGSVQQSKITIPEDGVAQPIAIGSQPEVTRGSKTLEVWLEDSAGKRLGQSTLTREDFISAPMRASGNH